VNDWTEFRLGDLIRIRHGWPFKSELCSEDLSGRPIVINIGNYQYTGGFRFDTTNVREYRGEYPDEYELSPDESEIQKFFYFRTVRLTESLRQTELEE
jgi:type I restriction enzyme S subunit